MYLHRHYKSHVCETKCDPTIKYSATLTSEENRNRVSFGIFLDSANTVKHENAVMMFDNGYAFLNLHSDVLEAISEEMRISFRKLNLSISLPSCTIIFDNN